ncbi:MAG: pyridoxamine 5'-phosphate oxidase family protein [Bacteroidetes bacterium]|nr:pyridoxamine 5'-phosphate oxidase family protein [Bacteroidota bacterium]
MKNSYQHVTDKKIIEEILSKSRICRLGLLDRDRAYIVPLDYGYTENTLYFHSAPIGKKIDLIKQSNFACFEIEYHSELITHQKACKWTTCYRSIIGYGHIELLSEYDDKLKALTFLMQHNGATGELKFEKKQVEFVAVLKLSITEMSCRQSSNWDRVLQQTC